MIGNFWFRRITHFPRDGPLLSTGDRDIAHTTPLPLLLLTMEPIGRKEVVRVVEIPNVFIRRTQGRRGAVGEITNDVLHRSVEAERWSIP